MDGGSRAPFYPPRLALVYHHLTVSVPRVSTAPSRFPITRWSLVINAATGDATGAAALAWLCERYWQPLCAHAARRGWRPASAEDLVQQLLMEIIARRDLATVQADRGRFRTWLMTCLDHLASHERARRAAAKRGGGVATIGLDELPVASAGDDAAREFDRAWAREVIARGIERLAEQERQRGTGAVFDALRPHLTANAEAQRYAAIGSALGLSEGAVRVAMHRLRQRLGEALREELAETLAEPTPAAVEAELAALLAAAGSR